MRKASHYFMAALTLLMLVNAGYKALAGHHKVSKSSQKTVSNAIQKAPNGSYTYYDKNGEKIIHFCNFDWHIRPSGSGSPGPNMWSSDNVWLDASGYLHIALTKSNNTWYSSEIYTDKHLGFGAYQFMLYGAVDKLDKNVVFGIYPYPDDSKTQDGTNEIDIEFSRWGNAAWPNLNYTVWPVSKNQKSQSRSVNFKLSSALSTHRFIWKPNGILFQSLDGLTNTTDNLLANWLYAPSNPSAHVSQIPQTLHFNLWTVDGKAPSNGLPVEIIFTDFTYIPS